MPSLLEDLRWRGLVHQLTDEEVLPERLAGGGMSVYIGFDPSADSLHVGHLQQLCLLRRFREAGHRPIALVGGGTGMVGDPSGKSEERNLLDPKELDRNREAIRAQITRVLGVPDGRTQSDTIVVDNAEWLAGALLLEFLRDVGKHFSVNEMIRKDSVRARLDGREQSLSFTEFSYMLLQSWDFVQLFDRYDCALQLGGSDQWGNITEGVDLIRRLRGERAYGLTSPLVTKSDGTKFGKTESGSVWLDPERTSPYSFSQFWLRTTDRDAGDYLRRFTFLDHARIEELDQATSERPERREAQRVLAFEMTALVHGADEARRALDAASVLFTGDIGQLDLPTLQGALADAPATSIGRDELESGIEIGQVLVRTGLASSGGEARRLLKQRSVYVNGAQVEADRVIGPEDALHGRWILIRKGKRDQHVLRIEATSTS